MGASINCTIYSYYTILQSFMIETDRRGHKLSINDQTLDGRFEVNKLTPIVTLLGLKELP